MKALTDFQTVLSSAVRNLDRKLLMVDATVSQERKLPTGPLREAEKEALEDTMKEAVLLFARVADRIEEIRAVEAQCDEEEAFIERKSL